MAVKSQSNPAPRPPDSDAHWQTGNKSAVGTSADDASPVWFTTSGGIITEVFYPNVDTPQMRDLQLLFVDETASTYHFIDDFNVVARPMPGASPTDNSMGMLITATCKTANYGFTQEIITEPNAPCLLVRTQLTGNAAIVQRMHVYALLAPHIDGRGAGNSAYVIETRSERFVGAYRNGRWLLLGADCGFVTIGCGFVSFNDGWQDIIARRRLPAWNFDCAIDGQVAMTAEINRKGNAQFVLAVAFGEGDDSPPNSVVISLTESLAFPFEAPPPRYSHKVAFLEGWRKSPTAFTPDPTVIADGGALFRHSRNVLMSHEDKHYMGALVASLSLPWGNVAGDSNGGYHMVWPRDMCQSATALLAANEFDLPLRGLMFLAASQSKDGSFPQKFYLNGQPLLDDVTNQQLDEYSFPIILAWRLSALKKLAGFDPVPMVKGAAYAIIAYGPMTQQERWEEAQGYSPSTLASNIAALVCAAEFITDPTTHDFLLAHADFLEAHLESWCVTNNGVLLPAVRRHYIRLLPTFVKNLAPGDPKRNPRRGENPDTDEPIFQIANVDNVFVRPREIADAGFLELVRYGIRKGGDPLIEDSLKVVDALLRKPFNNGCFAYLRYNRDGYGQFSDGRPYQNTGLGHPWPLLAGERGHYELAAGRDPKPYIKILETLAGPERLLPEQTWELNDVPNAVPPLFNGCPTGSSRPLAWAHAEYIRLVRSASDSIAAPRPMIFDFIDPVVKRYQSATFVKSNLEVWNFDRQIPAIPRGRTLRIPLGGDFRLRWSPDGGATWNDTNATATTIGVYFADIPTSAAAAGPLRFTFFWLPAGIWNGGQDFVVDIM